MKKLVLKSIDLYRKYLSPINFGRMTCRFTPSCADYTYSAVDKYGVIKGCLLGVWRILRCNPFAHGGYDPVK